MLCVSNRPSALQTDRKRCACKRPGASSAANGVRPLKEKLLNISSVTGLADPFVKELEISKAESPSRCARRCSTEQPSARESFVTMVTRFCSFKTFCSTDLNWATEPDCRSV